MAKEKKLVEAITSMEEDFAVVYRCGEKSRALWLYKCKRLHGNQTGRLRHLGKHSA